MKSAHNLYISKQLYTKKFSNNYSNFIYQILILLAPIYLMTIFTDQKQKRWNALEF